MPDCVPAAIAPWHKVEQAVRDVMHAYAYCEMRTPILEDTSLFVRSIGEATDIVEKEMYSFSSRKGASMTMRPENTAGCVRAAIENGLLQQGSVNRIWYLGPMFRYERPQLGRQRQFFQTGAEVYGLAGAAIEAELIMLSARLWDHLGIRRAMQLEINTLGDMQDRNRYRETLVGYFKQHMNVLDDDSLRRLERNPLRILDSKNPDMQEMVSNAPALRESLSAESQAHFDELQELLAASGVDVVINPRLVRGLDYYSHTVFEWTTDKLGAQSALCAGGRYDGLLDQLGAPGVPGVGWAFGMERVIALMDQLDVAPPPDVPDVFVIGAGDAPASAVLALAEEVRTAVPGIAVLQNTAGGSMKSQFRKADKSGAAVSLILGDSEVESNTITIKPMRGGEQQSVPRSDLIETLSGLLTA